MSTRTCTNTTPTLSLYASASTPLISSITSLHIGDRVQVNPTMAGVVRFIGPTKFKAGTWAGIELDTVGLGKNNGSVDGKRYFTCPPKTGLFILALKLAKQQQNLNLMMRPSTPHKKQPSFYDNMSLPPTPTIPSAFINNTQDSTSSLLNRIKALETENKNLRDTNILKDDRIKKLEKSVQGVKKVSMESMEVLESMVQSQQQKIDQLTAQLESEKKRATLLETEKNELKRAELETLETITGYEAVWEEDQAKLVKIHHHEIKILLQDIDILETVLQSKMDKEIDLTESLKREQQTNYSLTAELKGIKFQLKSTRTNGSIHAPACIEEEVEDTDCTLCGKYGHDLIHCQLIV